MKLNSKQLFLLSALFLATGDSAPQSDFCCPANEGEWAEVYSQLRDGKLLDENFNLTGYGKARCHNAESQGVNLEKLAQKNPNMALAMLRESVKAIGERYEEGYEFSSRAFKMFGDLSAELGHLAAEASIKG